MSGADVIAIALERTGSEPAGERLGRLFDAHHRRLYGLARRMTRSHDDALDLLQETFLRAAREPKRLPADDAGCEPWLVRTLVNLCRDRARRAVVRRRAADDPRLESATSRSGEAASAARLDVEAALARLAPRQRAIVVLHELEERDVREIAALLGIANVTVRWHLAAARRALRALFTENRR